jgi:hypothetical protein
LREIHRFGKLPNKLAGEIEAMQDRAIQLDKELKHARKFLSGAKKKKAVETIIKAKDENQARYLEAVTEATDYQAGRRGKTARKGS